MDATLNQTDVSTNNNKFYHIQLLERDDCDITAYAVWCRWGRVGEKGGSQMKTDETGVTLDQALLKFNHYMMDKSGKSWAERRSAIGGGKKYAYLERNYEDDVDKTGSPELEVPKAMESAGMAESTIPPQLQDLMKLIFNTNFMDDYMSELSYDSKKLPLGELSETTITAGFTELKKLGEVIADPSSAMQKHSEHGDTVTAILQRLTGRYYTLIPHNFGRRRPPTIETLQDLKKETELVENLLDMKISKQIMKDSLRNAKTVHPLDHQLRSLCLDEASALDKSSLEFQHLEKYAQAYAKKTKDVTHSQMNLTIQQIFRISRTSEDFRWVQSGWHNLHDRDDRRLLWHGSRTTNFGGILKQGLRIAPSEAPLNGYKFGKGIYLSDMFTKSAGYCYAGASENMGLLMLCETQLGTPMLELLHGDHQAADKCRADGRFATKGVGKIRPAKWEDACIVHERIAGVKMPKVSRTKVEITTDFAMATRATMQRPVLTYNEYVVYDVSQVKIRYLFVVGFS